MCEPITVGLGTLVGAGSGLTGAAATAAAASAGTTILGGVISGVGSAWAGASARKAEEKSRIAEQNRRSARYEGVGESTRYWENGQANAQTGEMTTKSIATAPALGRRPDQIGSKYSKPTTPQQPQQAKPRWRFDPETNQIGKS